MNNDFNALIEQTQAVGRMVKTIHRLQLIGSLEVDSYVLSHAFRQLLAATVCVFFPRLLSLKVSLL
jgi:hypothetical protein